MKDRIISYCDQLTFGSLFVLVTLYPLVVNPFYAPIFTAFKLFVLRVIMLVMVSAWLIKTVHQERLELDPHPLNWSVLVFMVIAVLSTAFSINPLVALFGEYSRWEGLLTLVSYGLIFLVALNWKTDENKLKLLAYGLATGALAVSVIGLTEHFGLNPVLRYTPTGCGAGYGALSAGAATSRSFSTFGNAAFLGGYLALVFPVLLSLLLMAKHNWKTLVFLVVTNAAVFGCWLFTLARAAWLGVLAGAVFLCLIGWPRLKKHRTIILVSLTVMVIAATVIVVSPTRTGLSVRALGERFLSILDFSRDAGAENRFNMWKHTFPLMADHPLLGTGPDTYKIAFTKYKPSYWTTSYKNPQLDKAHNELFQLGATLGFPGAIAFVWIVCLFMGSSWRQRAELKETVPDALATGMMAGVLSYFINLQFVFSHLSVNPLFWLFLGLTPAILRTGQTEQKKMSLELKWNDLSKNMFSIGIIVIAAVLAVFSLRWWQADASFNKANIYRISRDRSAILADLEKAVELNPFSPDYYFYLAKEYGEAALSAEDETTFKQYYDRSVQAWQKAESLNPLDESIYSTRGRIELGAGRRLKDQAYFLQAVALFQKSLVLNPSSSDAYLDLGAAYGMLGRFSEAIKAWRQTVSIDPRNADAYYNLGWAYQYLKDKRKAEQYFRKALELHRGCKLKNCSVCQDSKKALEALQDQ